MLATNYTASVERKLAAGMGQLTTDWGRMIFHVSDIEAFCAYLKEKGFESKRPADASWGERYFHMNDPDGHELSFARPLLNR
jgi:uncharacterized glyoxalase superfamily protein PhnB